MPDEHAPEPTRDPRRLQDRAGRGIPMPEPLARRPLDLLGDEIAGGAEGHGGGVVAAATASLAASLVVMVARDSADRWDDAEGVAAQAAALRVRATELADTDAAAYGAARRAVRDALAQRSGRPLGPLLHAAADVPFRIGETAADIAELAAEAARHGGADHRPDAAVAAALAEAAVRAASVLVNVNLAVSPDDDLATQTRHDLAAASAARDAAEALVD